MYKLISYISLLLLLVAISASCDPQEVELPSWKSELLVPLFEADFDFQDLTLSETLRLDADSTDALTVVYISDKDTIKVMELISIPELEIDFQLPLVPNTLDDFGFEVLLSNSELGVPEGQNLVIPLFTIGQIDNQVDITNQFIEAEFETGFIDLEIVNQFPFSINAGMVIQVSNTSDAQLVFSHTTIADVPSFGSYSLPMPISLANKVVEGDLTVTFNNISSPGANDVTISEANSLSLKLDVYDLSLLSATMVLREFTTGQLVESYEFSLPNGALLQSLSLKAGKLSVTIGETTNLPISLEFEFPSISLSNGVLHEELELNSFEEIVYDLANATIDFTNGGSNDHNTINTGFELSSSGSTEPVFIDFKKTYSGKLILSSIELQAVFGYLGTFDDVLMGDVKIDIFERVVNGAISFNDPIVIAFIENEFGVGASLKDDETVYIRAQNPTLYPGQVVDIGDILKHSSIEGAESPGEILISSIELNGTNESKFEDFISLLPSMIEYQFSIAIGTSIVEYNQFVLDTSKVYSQIQVELPLDLEANNLTIVDTLGFDIGIDSEYADVVSGVLTTKIRNIFPFELLLQSYFMDSTYSIIDSLFLDTKLISSGNVDASGKVITPFEVEFSINVAAEKLDNVMNAAFIKPVFVINTFNQERVKIFSDSKVQLKMNGDFNIELTNSP